MNEKQIAQEILNQLGGNRFLVMTGTKNLSYSKNEKGEITLRMHLAKNASKAKYLSVTLNNLDLYDMEFSTTKNYDHIAVETYENVYCDMLEDIFNRVTKLATKL